jgi:hypothetical protein
MKTTVVPAQITTVEDRIIGNFTFAQILILIIPLITSTVIYVLLSPRMHLNYGKSVLMVAQFFVFGLLAMRVNGKILAEWLAVFIRFTRRNRVYVFTKNDLLTRDVETPVMVAQTTKTVAKKQPVKEIATSQPLTLSEKEKIDQLMSSSKLSVKFAFAKKGGIDVSLKPIKN